MCGVNAVALSCLFRPHLERRLAFVAAVDKKPFAAAPLFEWQGQSIYSAVKWGKKAN